MEKFKIKHKLKLFLLACLFTLLLILLTGCSRNTENILDDKIESELDYLESNIYNIAYKYAAGEYEENILNDNVIMNIVNDSGLDKNSDLTDLEIKIINFDNVKDDVKKVNQSLDVLMVDLSEKNVDTNMIMSISENTNNLIVNTADENINIVLRDVNEIEKIVVKNYDILSINNSKKKLKSLKAEILNVFISSIIYEEKQTSKLLVNDLLNNFSENLKDQEFVSENQYLVNKLYVLIQELKTAVDLENEELIKVKYLSLIDIL